MRSAGETPADQPARTPAFHLQTHAIVYRNAGVLAGWTGGVLAAPSEPHHELRPAPLPIAQCEREGVIREDLLHDREA
jgi:hypothetical protein